MSWMISALLFVFVAIVSIALGTKRRATQKPSYAKRDALFTKAERSFLGVLDQAVGQDYRVFGQVRVADILKPKPGLSASDRTGAVNRINAKHFDFVLCDPNDLSVACVIELDDKSHQKKARRERDAFLAEACESADLSLLRIRARRAYSVADLRKQIQIAAGVSDPSRSERIDQLSRSLDYV